MFDDIRSDIRLKTYVSCILAACMFIITCFDGICPSVL